MPSIAENDIFAVAENGTILASVFDDNGNGPDIGDPGFEVVAVNGIAAAVGQQITLPSGALLTLNSDGTFTYDPNNAFDGLAATGSGASNTGAQDGFTYTVTDGATAFVQVNVSGVDSDGDVLIGTSGADTLTGGASDNTLMGLGGADTLDGGGGNNVLMGGANSDTYIVHSENDIVVEFANQGTDIVETDLEYYALTAHVEMLAGTAIAGQWLVGNDSFNLISGGDGDDKIEGRGGADTLAGGDGFNELIGGEGSDTYIVTSEYDWIVELENQGEDLVRTDLDYFSIAGFDNVENLTGTQVCGCGQWLVGNDLDNVITGSAGDDDLDGGEGADTLIGGDGWDWYYVDNTGDVVIELDNEDGGMDVVFSMVTFTLDDNVEGLQLLGFGNLAGTGNALDNVIVGNFGNNVLAGLGGADEIDGDYGIDTASYAASGAGVNVSLMTGFGFGGDAEGDELYSIENLTGSNFNDTLEGCGCDNVLAGGTGIDTLSYANADYGVTVSLAITTAQDTVGAGFDTVSGFENLTGSDYEDNLTGTGTANVLNGGDGDDQLFGGNGNDTLIGGDDNDWLDGGGDGDTLTGGEGDDTYVVNIKSDLIIEYADEGTDLVRAGLSFALSDNLENLILTGTGNSSGTGNALDNAITGNTGNNVLTGLGGADVLDGEGGSDAASYAASSVGVNVSLMTGVGTGGDAEGDELFSIENLVGSNENDTLEGCGCDNVLFGGGGIDTLSYANADAGVTVDLTLTVAQDTLGAGLDKISGFENLSGSGYDDTLTGNNASNVLNGGVGHDQLFGGIGNDTLNGGDDDDWLDGGAWADTMIGGTGDDTYVVDSNSDVVTEYVDEGIDTIQSAGTRTLGENIENLTLTGTGNFMGTGNASDNIIAGNGGKNILSGLGGADTLNGGAGSDTLSGGADGDLFVFDPLLSGVDTVTDFLGGSSGSADKIVLDIDVDVFGIDVTTLRADGHILYNSLSRTLSWDEDGNAGAGGATNIAILTGVTSLNDYDFILM